MYRNWIHISAAAGVPEEVALRAESARLRLESQLRRETARASIASALEVAPFRRTAENVIPANQATIAANQAIEAAEAAARAADQAAEAASITSKAIHQEILAARHAAAASREALGSAGDLLNAVIGVTRSSSERAAEMAQEKRGKAEFNAMIANQAAAEAMEAVRVAEATRGLLSRYFPAVIDRIIELYT